MTPRGIEILRRALGEKRKIKKKTNKPNPIIAIYLFCRIFLSVLLFLFLLPSLLDQAKHCIARRFLPAMTLGDFTAQMQIGFK